MTTSDRRDGLCNPTLTNKRLKKKQSPLNLNKEDSGILNVNVVSGFCYLELKKKICKVEAKDLSFEIIFLYHKLKLKERFESIAYEVVKL